MKAEDRIIDIEPIKERKVYSEFYFGVGLGITVVHTSMVIILPFVMILITENE